MLRSSASNKSREVPGIKLRKLMAKDIPQIIAIHGAITKKKAYRRGIQQMVKDHLRKQEGESAMSIPPCYGMRSICSPFSSPSGLIGQLLLTSLNMLIRNQFTFLLDRSITVLLCKRT